MEFIVEIEKLKKVLSDASAVLSKNKNKNSIISNYYVSVSDNTLKLVATSDTMQYVTSIDVQTTGNFSFLAKAEVFDRLKILSGSTKFGFDNDKKLLTIQNGNFKSTAKVFGTEGYELQSLDSCEKFGTLESSDLLNLLKASIASSKEENQTREFTGTLIDVANGRFNCVATDRTSLFWINQATDLTGELYCLLEKDPVIILNKILKSDTRVDLYYKKIEDKVVKTVFAFDNTILFAKTIAGRLPQYQNIFLHELENVQHVVVDKKTLKESLSRVMLVDNQDIALVNLEIGENIKLSLTNSEGELAEDVLDYKESTQSISFTIRGQYVMNFLDSINDDDIFIYWIEAKKPVELKTEKDGVAYCYVMAPVR